MRPGDKMIWYKWKGGSSINCIKIPVVIVKVSERSIKIKREDTGAITRTIAENLEKEKTSQGVNK